MSTPVAEQYGAAPLAANATFPVPASSQIGGFLCCVTGSLSLGKGTDGSGVKIVDTLPVTAGIYYPIPMSTGEPVAIILSGGARGTMFGNW